jgi:hypothetical protein
MPPGMRSTSIFLQYRFFRHLAASEKNIPHHISFDNGLFIGDHIYSVVMVE